MTNISHYDFLCPRFLHQESPIMKSGRRSFIEAMPRRVNGISPWLDFNSSSKPRVSVINAHENANYGHRRDSCKMWSAEFAEISWWFGTSDSASVRKTFEATFCRPPGARFVASSRIETFSSFRFENRFFIWFSPTFHRRKTNFFLAERCAIKNRTANKKNFLPFSICNLWRSSAAKAEVEDFNEIFFHARTSPGFKCQCEFSSGKFHFHQTFPTSNFKPKSALANFIFFHQKFKTQKLYCIPIPFAASHSLGFFERIFIWTFLSCWYLFFGCVHVRNKRRTSCLHFPIIFGAFFEFKVPSVVSMSKWQFVPVWCQVLLDTFVVQVASWCLRKFDWLCRQFFWFFNRRLPLELMLRDI